MNTMLGRCVLSLFFIGPCACAAPLQLHVDAGNGHGQIRKRFVYSGCGGQDLSPAMHWQGAPVGTRSFALTVFDPDANGGAGWWHWVVINLPASTHALAQGAAISPPAMSLRNDFGNRHWDGPCPPRGDPPHHYVFTLYALDMPIVGTRRQDRPESILPILHHHALASSTASFTYAR